MDQQKAITVNIVNRSYPPNSGMTGESAAELAAYLLDKGIQINALHVDADYRKGTVQKKTIGNSHKIKTFYNGKNKFLRLFSNLYEGISILRKSQSLKPDVTICMTEPPLLNICAALIFKKKQKWILWSMDLFPEALSSGRIVTTSGFIYNFLDRIVLKNKPWHIISLGEYQTRYLQNKFGADVTFTNLPCGIYKETSEGSMNPPSWAENKTKIIFGYCGNIGEAHSTEFITSFIDTLNPERHKLVLALYGSKAKEVLAYAEGKPGVEILGFVNRVDMKYIDVHLASLKKEWVNVCVPSKAVSSVCCGSALLYDGDAESDNWHLLQRAGWRLREENLNEEIASLLKTLDRATVEQKKSEAVKLAEELNEMKNAAFHQIYSKITSL
ncbi:hypothetical protein SAMN04488109_2478 [Chryseolinea serpens]|uniref:Uncharacterized protein n=1 Tax=Chryseolinea serpens TaxID=947013 RepID=A0A1M5NSX5_9BACT|nr:hypothetical protein [Chryseolinea serpens]SHG92063.1 hypothetical protein SAMN04488109_2478 [Chryseolinea serpens]